MRECQGVAAPDDAEAFLQGVSFMQGLDAHARHALAAQLEWFAVPGGTRVFREGDAPDGLYLLYAGRVRVEHPDGEVLADLGPPETFGELALITGQPRRADARAVRDAVIARLPPAGFEGLFASEPSLARAMTHTLARWLTGDRQRSVHSHILTLVSGHRDAPVGAVLLRLCRALETFGSLRVVTQRDAEDMLGEPLPHEGSIGEEQFARWVALVDRIEAAHDAVIFVVEHRESVFRRLCARQSDTILMVAAPQSHRVALPALEVMRHELPREVLQRVELLMVRRRADSPPQNSSSWLSLHAFRAYHHLALDRPQDALRVVRRLTQRAVGIVLSGGGARGFAHIGVLHALREAGVPIDAVGGTSMGAIIAAQFAAGWSRERMVQQNFAMWRQHRPHKAYTVPITSLVSAEPAFAMLAEMFGGARFEDLDLPTYATSSNLTRATMLIHERGPLSSWLACSMAIPGVGPPVPTLEGDLLVDGGVLDNLPLRPMRQLRVPHIGAVNVSPRFDPRIKSPYSDMPSWSKVLRDRWRGDDAQRRHPHLLELLTRAVHLKSAERAHDKRARVDLWIEPDVGQYSLLDMEPVAEIAERGQRYVEALDREGMLDRLRLAAQPAAETGSTASMQREPGASAEGPAPPHPADPQPGAR